MLDCGKGKQINPLSQQTRTQPPKKLSPHHFITALAVRCGGEARSHLRCMVKVQGIQLSLYRLISTAMLFSVSISTWTR